MNRIPFLIFLLLLLQLGCHSPYRPKSRRFPRYRRQTLKDTAKLHEKYKIPNRRYKTQQLLKEIKKYLGTPYRYSGQDKNGMDCSGLVVQVFRRAYQVELPHNSKQLAQLGKPIAVNSWKTGDLIFFRTGKAREISHVGVYLSHAKFVHTSTSRGVVISDLAKEKYYRKRYAGARRIMNIY